MDMSSGLQDAAEQLAVVLTSHGLQRMTARVLATLLFTEQPNVTMGELATTLNASAGAISGALKMLTSVGLAERVAALDGLQSVGAAGSRRAVDDLQVSLTADFDLAGVQTIEVCCVAGGHADALPCRNVVQRGSLDDCAVDCAGQRCLAGGRVAAEDHTVELVLGVPLEVSFLFLD